MCGNRSFFSVDYLKLLVKTPSLNINSIIVALEENTRMQQQENIDEQQSSVESIHETLSSEELYLTEQNVAYLVTPGWGS